MPLPVAFDRAGYANGCLKNRASAEKLCILSENAAAASAQALAELFLLCDVILTSNLATDRAPRHENIACSVLSHSAAKAQFLRVAEPKRGKCGSASRSTACKQSISV